MSQYAVVSSNLAAEGTLGAIPEAPEKCVFAGLMGLGLTIVSNQLHLV